MTAKKEFQKYKTIGLMISKFSGYVKWSVHSNISDQSKPFIISVIGKNPFIIRKKGRITDKDWLNQLYLERKILNKTVSIRFITEVEDIPGSHVLFIASSEKRRLKEITKVARENSVLTMSSTSGFAKKGIYINFYTKKNNIGFEINVITLNESGFRMPARVLKLAKVIKK
ncbi:MAG: YfiR family protein [bacterium]|nr:YfiR family protein [bacterium]